MNAPTTTATLPPRSEAPETPKEGVYSLAEMLQLVKVLFAMDMSDETSATLGAMVELNRAPTVMATQPPLTMPPDEEGARDAEELEHVLLAKRMETLRA